MIPLILAEDISAAFESIDHNLIARYAQRHFDDDGDFKMKDLLLSYLDRKSDIIDRDSDERVNIRKRYSTRTSPQGSILSPALWRIFDHAFSTLYKNALGQLVDQHEYLLNETLHVAYADDHVTVICLVVDMNETDHAIDLLSKKTALQCRALLDDATKAVGCGINSKK